MSGRFSHKGLGSLIGALSPRFSLARYPGGGWWRGRSIADAPHRHERERSRRLRQHAQVELNRANRYLRSVGKPTVGFADKLPEFGLTRRGRKVRL